MSQALLLGGPLSNRVIADGHGSEVTVRIMSFSADGMRVCRVAPNSTVVAVEANAVYRYSQDDSDSEYRVFRFSELIDV